MQKRATAGGLTGTASKRGVEGSSPSGRTNLNSSILGRS